jgi:hypothetical protein
MVMIEVMANDHVKAMTMISTARRVHFQPFRRVRNTFRTGDSAKLADFPALHSSCLGGKFRGCLFLQLLVHRQPMHGMQGATDAARRPAAPAARQLADQMAVLTGFDMPGVNDGLSTIQPLWRLAKHG